jgi:hypothetical protein
VRERERAWEEGNEAERRQEEGGTGREGDRVLNDFRFW